MPAAAALPASPLLPTKLFIPVLGADLVERTRLLGTMNDTQRARLVLVSAPAGAGKTTLVTQWVRRVDVPACWVSVRQQPAWPWRYKASMCSGFCAAILSIHCCFPPCWLLFSIPKPIDTAP